MAAIDFDLVTSIIVGGRPLGGVIKDIRQRLSHLETELLKRPERSALDAKADKLYVDTHFARTDYVSIELSRKADKEYTIVELAKKTEKAFLENQLSLYLMKAQYVDDMRLKADDQFVQVELERKADKAFITSALEKKANAACVEMRLASKADQTYVDDELLLKVDKSCLASELAKKANMSSVDVELGKLVQQMQKKVDKEVAEHEFAKLENKADKTYVLGELLSKADKSEIESLISAKADKDYVDSELGKKAGLDVYSELARKVMKELDIALQETINFQSCSAILDKSAYPVLRKVASILKKYPDMNICVEGHTGCTCVSSIGAGSPAKRARRECKAIELSNERAQAVGRALMEAGCTNSMRFRGYGCVQRIGMAVKIFPARGQ
eukprot:TRINITY_DN22539_c0_g1_i1.p1 TRINITY_DN22539_c0_g1~~TRINITY_DN22539_c0_g1_i1.p1  ORF type:complete len:385 (+),score=75.56 TRINITY_DN22539_c0_g1_i1:70-1224(+)